MARTSFGHALAFTALLACSLLHAAIAAPAANTGPAATRENSTGQAKKTRPPGAERKTAPAAEKPDRIPPECVVAPEGASGPRNVQSEPTPITARRREAACFIAPREAIARSAAGTLLLVDVRGPNAFAQYRIPGSLGIAPEFVKTKDFLRTQPFALVNEGGYSAALERLCTDLKAAGFREARVVRGGLRGWKQAKGVLEGDLLAQRRMNFVLPAEFAEERRYPDWLVVDLSAQPRSAVQTFLPNAISLPAREANERLAAAFKSAVARRTGKRKDVKVLVVDQDSSRYERLEVLLAGSVPLPVFFLQGGLSAYRKFWTEQHAIWAAAGRAPRSPKCGA